MRSDCVAMTSVQDIEAAVEQLAPEQRAHFRAWFEAFDAREGSADRGRPLLWAAGLAG